MSNQLTAYVIKHVKSGPGYAWTDNQAVFLDKTEAEAYLQECRIQDPDSDYGPDGDGHIDTNWFIEELPLSPEQLPEIKNYRWAVSQ